MPSGSVAIPELGRWGRRVDTYTGEQPLQRVRAQNSSSREQYWRDVLESRCRAKDWSAERRAGVSRTLSATDYWELEVLVVPLMPETQRYGVKQNCTSVPPPGPLLSSQYSQAW